MECNFCKNQSELPYCRKHWFFLDAKFKRLIKDLTDQDTLNEANESLITKYKQWIPGDQFIYYAHPMGFYGSQIEQDSISLIKQQYPSLPILNPGESIYQGQPMIFYNQLASQSALVIAQPYLSEDSIGAGVASEIETAKEMNIPVLIIQHGTIFNYNEKEFKILSISSTARMNRQIY
jgi:hypothetical protein